MRRREAARAARRDVRVAFGGRSRPLRSEVGRGLISMAGVGVGEGVRRSVDFPATVRAGAPRRLLRAHRLREGRPDDAGWPGEHADPEGCDRGAEHAAPSGVMG